MDKKTESMKRVVILADLALDLGAPEAARATAHQDGVTPETVTTHTVMLGWVACELAHLWAGAPGVPSVGDVAQMALVHDAVEALVGDTDTLGASEDALKAKAEREASAIRELLQRVGHESWMGQAIQRYEAQACAASRWVRYVDKVSPKLTHGLNGCATIIAKGMPAEELRRIHEEQEEKLQRQYPEFPQLRILLYDACRWSEEVYGETCRPPTGLSLIQAERARQFSEEGWTPEHDDWHEHGELALYVYCYAVPPNNRDTSMLVKKYIPYAWPFSEAWWKPGPRIRELAKAGALIAAEIDRLHRAGEYAGDDRAPSTTTTEELPHRWTWHDQGIAEDEGWALFEGSGSVAGPYLYIDCDLDAEVFKNADEATLYVMKRAFEGSELHRRALKINLARLLPSEVEGWGDPR